MKAFVDTEITKQQFSDNIKWHHDHDNLIKGTYWDRDVWKGCAVGCQFHNYEEVGCTLHETGEELTNVPREMYELEDVIFEQLPLDKAKEWPLRFDAALKEGADYTKVANHFMVWLLVDPQHGVIKYADERGKKAIRKVASLHKRVIKGVKVRQSIWAADESSAMYAARAAADATARVAAGDAAWAAAWAADRERMADKLIELMEDANNVQ